MPGNTGQRDAAIALRDTIGKATGDISGTTADFEHATAEASVQGARAMDDVDNQYGGKLGDLGQKPDAVPEAKPEDAPQSSPSTGQKRSRIQDALEPKPKRAKFAPKDTPEGKAQRWARYQERISDPKVQDAIKAGKRRAPLDYDGWSNVYDSNIFKPEKATEATRNYAQRKDLTADGGWTEEHSVGVSSGKTRRIDLANPDTQEGIEYKSGSVPKGAKTTAEITGDVDLIDRGWNIKWVFKTQPAPWLKQELEAKGIPWELDR